ncbi:hypothetical protein GCM10008924_23860 [Gracilibacillus halotolerans]
MPISLRRTRNLLEAVLCQNTTYFDKENKLSTYIYIKNEEIGKDRNNFYKDKRFFYEASIYKKSKLAIKEYKRTDEQ